MKIPSLNSFRSRLLGSMLLTALLPLLICTNLSIQINRLQMDSNNAQESASQSQALTDNLDALSSGMSSAVAALRSSSQLCLALDGVPADRLEINSLLYEATETIRGNAAFDLYDSDGICRYSTQSDLTGTTLPTDWGLLYGAAHSDQPVWYPCEDPMDLTGPLLSSAARLSASGSQEEYGYLVMRVYVDGLREIMSEKSPLSDVLLLSSFFRPIFASTGTLNTTLAPLLRQQLLEGRVLNDESYLYTVTRHQPTGLFLVLRLPRTFTRSTARLLLTAALICVLVSLVISVLLSVSLSRQISLPVTRLQRAFGKLEQGDLETKVTVSGEDELNQLAIRFNNTVDSLRANRRQLIQNQQELNEAQIRMLQAQLNPHFLCNTLDTMKWISKINKVPQVAILSTDLGDILRFAISSEEFVPLYRELEILERYIEIQKLRLSDNFTFSTQINEELYDCLVPKMILQPIVENAILHGLDGVENSTILIEADFDSPDSFHITVTDNGRGFPPEMLGRPYRREKNLAKGHLGLYNVDTILRRFFGEEWGLTLCNGSCGVGASVTAALPVRFEEETEC